MGGPRHPRSGVIASTVWTLWLVALASSVLALVEARSGGPADPASAAESLLIVLSTATVGAVLVTRVPGNAVGWLLLVGGVSTGFSAGFGALADYGLNLHPGSVPGAVWFAVFASVAGAPGPGLMLGFAPFFFPNGRLPSPRWWVVIPIGAVPTLLPAILGLIGPFAAGTYPPGVENPLALTAGEGLIAALGALSNAIAVLALMLVMASLVVRYRRAAGIEHQQIRWFAFVALIAALALSVSSAAWTLPGATAVTISTATWLLAEAGLVLMPIAIGTAILRYRLYDIDRIISRTIGWAVVTGVLVVVFAGAILLFQAVLAPLTGESTVAVAASTLLVATLFQPLRRRVQARVDRRFNRSRYDADRTVAAFAERLRDEVDLDQLGAEVRATVVQTVAPATVSLWLRE